MKFKLIVLFIISTLIYSNLLYSKNIKKQVSDFSARVESVNIPKWRLQITFPNYEVKHFKLSKKQFKMFLPKTAWRCTLSSSKKNAGIFLKSLICRYSSYKRGIISSKVSCSKYQKYRAYQIDLIDNNKNLTYKILITCDL